MRPKIALIGTGAAAMTHAEAYQAMDLVDVKWVYSHTPDRAATFSRKYGIPAHTGDFDAIVNDPQIDFVDICSIPDSHILFSERALEKGKGIIIEKPLSHEVAQASAFYERFWDVDLPILVVYQYPYSETFGKLRQFIETGVYGRIKSYRVKYFTYMEPAFYEGWPASMRKVGGGALINHGIHFINWIYGSLAPSPMEVTATAGNITYPVEVEDTIDIHVLHDDGRIGAFQFSTGLPSELLIEFFFEEAYVWTRGGSVVVEGMRKETIETPRKGDFSMLAEAFLAKWKTNPVHKMNFREALWDMIFVDAAYVSAKTHQGVRIDPDSRIPLPRTINGNTAAD